MASKTILPVDLKDGITPDNIGRLEEWLERLHAELLRLQAALNAAYDAKAADDV